jgi:hypothetical protein
MVARDDRYRLCHQVVDRGCGGRGCAVASYEHAYELVRAHGETGWTGRLVPLTVDGLIYVSSMVMLDSARRKVPVPALARWLLGLGITATLAANVAHGLGARNASSVSMRGFGAAHEQQTMIGLQTAATS